MTEELIKKKLQEVRVCKSDALAIEKKFKGELFGKLHERCEIVKVSDIPKREIFDFIDHMGKAYEGIGEKEKEQLKAIKWTPQIETRIMEFKFNMDSNDDMYKSRYGMVVLASSGDTIGCMYVLYKMDFKIAVSKMRSLLWGLFKWEVSDPNNIARVVNSASFHNFFRMKAIDEFYKEGIIDSINEVSNIASC